MGSDKNEKTVYYLGNETTWDARVLFRCHRYQSTDSSLPIYFHHETYHINFFVQASVIQQGRTLGRTTRARIAWGTSR